jgi:dolichol-phosphate mannosyltransferase
MIGVIVNASLLYILTEYIQMYYIYAGAISVEISIISNFIWNDLWTFKDIRNRPKWQRFVSFQLISIFAIGIYVILLYIYTDIFHIYYLISNLMTIPVTVCWNYGMNKFITWKSK